MFQKVRSIAVCLFLALFAVLCLGCKTDAEKKSILTFREVFDGGFFGPHAYIMKDTETGKEYIVFSGYSVTVIPR